MNDLYARWLEKPFALSQSAHNEINATHYPGTRQLCDLCSAPTGRCEDDTLYCEPCGVDRLCEECYAEHMEHQP